MNRGDGMESGMKIKSPQISIIVPVYNTVAYLDKCLNSILNQTYDSLEVICVDDGSTDGSADIVAKYENQDSRVKVIHQPNGGESNARNKGLQAATGDFIGFVDGDDWLELDMYEKLYELICKDESDLAAVGYFIDKDNKSIPAINEWEIPEGVYSRDKFLEYVYHRDKHRAVTSWIWCKLFRRNILMNEENNALLFDELIRLGGDLIFFAQAMLNVKKVSYSPDPYYHYYQRGSSTYHTKQPEIWMDLVKTYEILIKLFYSNKIPKNIIEWVQRFLVYRAEVTAKYAYMYKENEILRNCQKIMEEHREVYYKKNRDYPERLLEYEEILKYVL